MADAGLVIIGAGLSGLTTALFSRDDFLLLEKSSRPGGLLKTEDIEGFLFDFTGHWLHLRDPRTKDFIADLMGDGMVTVNRKAAIWSNGVMTLFPFQANLFGLPPAVIRECLQEAVASAVSRAAGTASVPGNFEEYANIHFGRGIARHFIVPYNTKLWGVPPSEVTAEWTQRFVPMPDIAQIIDGALGFSAQAMGYNVSFIYPATGGIESIPRAMAARLDHSRIMFNTAPTALNAEERWVEAGGRRISWDRLVSTTALPDLVKMTVDAPDVIRKAAAELRCSPLRFVNVALDVPTPLDGNHWIYLPETKYPFYRVGCFSNAVKSLAPAGKSSLYVELAPDTTMPEAEITAALQDFLIEIGSITEKSQLLFARYRNHPWGYVIFDERCVPARDLILGWYRSKGIKSIGRYGAWTYNSMEDAMLEAMAAAG